MGPLLIERWLADATIIEILDEASCSVVRQTIRAMAESAGLGEAAVSSMMTAGSELSMNHLVHAHRGSVGVRLISRGDVGGIEIIAADEGKGIADPAAALLGQSTGAGLGGGVSGAHRFCDEMDIDIRIGEGSCLWARKFASPLTRRRQVGVFGRPCPGETVSGDDASFVRTGDSLVVAVADGLGHGLLAREASSPAMSTFHAHADLSPSSVLESCDAALVGTRGAVMAVARWEEEGDLAHSAAGNVLACLHRRDHGRKLSGPSIVLGAPRPRPLRLRTEVVASLPRDVLAVFTDGLSSRAEIEPSWVNDHPVVIAQRLADKFGDGRDDVLVLVVR